MAGLDKRVRATLQPELQYNPRFRDGVAVCTFDILLEPEATVVHEWRSGLANRRIGPRLVFRPDQLLTGTDEEFLTAIPSEEWVHVEVECGLGKQAQVPAVYRVVVTYEGQLPDVYENLPCVHRRFRALDQCLFLASTEEETSHSLDNIHIVIK